MGAQEPEDDNENNVEQEPDRNADKMVIPTMEIPVAAMVAMIQQMKMVHLMREKPRKSRESKRF